MSLLPARSRRSLDLGNVADVTSIKSMIMPHKVRILLILGNVTSWPKQTGGLSPGLQCDHAHEMFSYPREPIIAQDDRVHICESEKKQQMTIVT